MNKKIREKGFKMKKKKIQCLQQYPVSTPHQI